MTESVVEAKAKRLDQAGSLIRAAVDIRDSLGVIVEVCAANLGALARDPAVVETRANAVPLRWVREHPYRESPLGIEAWIEQFLRRFVAADGDFDFAGARMPAAGALTSREGLLLMMLTFVDTFLVPCFFGDNHDAAVMRRLDPLMPEGPYGFVGEGVDARARPGDVVIDAGAWAGDFSAYAASRGAQVYAFEPTRNTFAMLLRTAALNGGDSAIIPLNFGLGAEESRAVFNIYEGDAAANTISRCLPLRVARTETINITNIDTFVRIAGLPRVDFIKADIEGAERDMLRGAADSAGLRPHAGHLHVPLSR